MGDETLYFPASGDTHQRSDEINFLEKSKNLCSLLFSNISKQKVSRLAGESRNNFESNLIEVLGNSLRVDEFASILCTMCRDNNMIRAVLSCSHAFCEVCLTHFRNKVEMMSRIRKSGYSLYTAICSAQCPICQIKLTEEDARFIWEDFDALKESVASDIVQDSIAREGVFTCLTCKKARGRAMQITGSCLHMCKSCMYSNYLSSKRMDCERCGYVFSTRALLDKNECSKCKTECYCLGDRMQETCPNHDYCAQCMSIVAEIGKCVECERVLSIKERAEYLEFILGLCAICEHDIFRIFLLKNECCGREICYYCQSTSQECRGCGNMIPLNVYERILRKLNVNRA